MGMPVIKNYNDTNNISADSTDTNVHYYGSDSYKNTIKSDGNKHYVWQAYHNYLYAGNAYQWWMLPAGSRKMSNGSQAYHNNNLYSYSALINNSNSYINRYWLRSASGFVDHNYFATYGGATYGGLLRDTYANEASGIVISFSF